MLIGTAQTPFFQTAAAVLAVLLLTGVVGELRQLQERREDQEGRVHERPYTRSEALMLYASFIVSSILVVGTIAASYALLTGSPTGWQQSVVGVALLVGLIGVPVLVWADPQPGPGWSASASAAGACQVE